MNHLNNIRMRVKRKNMIDQTYLVNNQNQKIKMISTYLDYGEQIVKYPMEESTYRSIVQPIEAESGISSKRPPKRKRRNPIVKTSTKRKNTVKIFCPNCVKGSGKFLGHRGRHKLKNTLPKFREIKQRYVANAPREWEVAAKARRKRERKRGQVREQERETWLKQEAKSRQERKQEREARLEQAAKARREQDAQWRREHEARLKQADNARREQDAQWRREREARLKQADNARREREAVSNVLRKRVVRKQEVAVVKIKKRNYITLYKHNILCSVFVFIICSLCYIIQT